MQLHEARASYSLVQAALADEAKLVRWHRAKSAGLPVHAIAAILAAAGSNTSSLTAVAGKADADTVLTAKVEVLEEKQLVMRQLVELDDSFVPPPDYKV